MSACGNCWKAFESGYEESEKAYTRTIATLTAERDQLLEDIKERDRTYLAVQKAEGLEREKVELERDALRTALEKIWLGDHLSDWAREVAREALGGKS